MSKFGKISEIEVGKENTWKDKIFITFDIDWAEDTIINYTIDILESKNINATFFVTHKTETLERLIKNPNFEIGIHPNFNFLLEGDYTQGKNAREVIQNLKDVVPHATSVRSHCMTQSSRLLDLFLDFGLSHDANHFIPHSSGITLKPWKMWNGLIRVPYNWEDDVECLYGWSNYIKNKNAKTDLQVYNFHPIHIYLNTEDMNRYEQTRSLHYSPKLLFEYRNKDYGSHSALLQLIEDQIK